MKVYLESVRRGAEAVWKRLLALIILGLACDPVGTVLDSEPPHPLRYENLVYRTRNEKKKDRSGSVGRCRWVLRC